jgi:hypothetical protein
VLNITEVMDFEPSASIVMEGEDGDALFIIMSGRVRVSRGEATITHLGSGQHFGEMALVDKAPRSASVTAEGEAKLLRIRRQDFFDIVRKDHDVAVKLLWSFLSVLAERLRNTSRDLGEAREQLAMEDLTNELLLGAAEDAPRDTLLDGSELAKKPMSSAAPPIPEAGIKGTRLRSAVGPDADLEEHRRTEKLEVRPGGPGDAEIVVDVDEAPPRDTIELRVDPPDED